MVRRGASLAAVLLAASLLACGGDDDDDADDTTPPDGATVTVPADADPGVGYLVLDGEPYLLTVRDCALDPVTAADPASGVTTEIEVAADDGVTRNVAITRRTVPGDVPTTTDNITIAVDGEVVAESQRIDIAGNYQDLRAPGVLEPLLAVDDGLVTARGVFGPLGSVNGDEGLVEGSLTLRCP
jgi:hypothetical protein